MTITPWFELLSEKKLLAHLASDSPDPSASELIVKLIAYAPRPSTPGSDVEVLPSGGADGDRRSAASLSLQQSARAARRVAGLQYKLLAVQIFAHCHWRFPALDKRVPLPMQQTLLTTLLSVCGGPALAEVLSHSELPLASLSPQAVFAVSLYHRWVLWSVCQLAMPSRPPRNASIPLPGQQDPTVVMPHVTEAARQSVELQAAGSLALLTRLASLAPSTLLPTVQTFGRYTETAPEPTHDWQRAVPVSSDELLCQLSFELGRYHFFKGMYGDAGRCFSISQRLYRPAPWRDSSQFVWLSEPELTGYCLAVNGSALPPPERPLYHRLQRSITDGYREIIDILLEDNVSRELPLTTRDTVARDVAAMVARRADRVPADLAHRIDIVNCVRRALEGRHQAVELSSALCGEPRLQRLLLDAVLAAGPACDADRDPAQCRERLRLLLLRTAQHAAGLIPALAQHGAGAALYPPGELAELVRLHGEAEEAELPTDPPPAATGIQDPIVEVGCLERRLMESYSPPELAATLRQLSELQPGRPLWRSNTRWLLPIPVQSVIMSLPPGFARDYFYIVMAKANELLQLKRFDGSRELLQAILEEAQSGPAQQGQTAAKLVRLIGWEKLLADLLQLLHNWPKLGDYRELTPRAKACLSALKTGSDVIPRSELVEHCTLYLLNVCQWDHLIDHLSEQERRGWTQMDLAALLAAVCRELVNKGNDRQMSRNLWNAVIPMFTVSGQQKRTALGACSSVQRDSPHAIMPRTQLTQFIQKVHEHTSLSVLTSLLTRLHNILLDDSTREMSLEHAGLWPNVVNNTNLFSLGSVSECLQTLLAQGIRLYPAHIPWLQGMADLRYAGDEPTSSLRHYLEACLVSSEYFSRPVPRTVLSEAMLRRMIKCCSTLHCYTQAAVLCQFLDEVDYASAFQYASERNCADAMDAYYDCIWDVTLLEYLTSLHHRRAERNKRQQVIRLIGQLELNSNNNEEIQREAAAVRKARFLRAMVKQYAA